MNVTVLGASNNPERYSYQAVKLLAGKGHSMFAGQDWHNPLRAEFAL